MIEKLYTVEEVAELASVTSRTIRNYLKAGRLEGRKIGGQWRFSQEEVQRLLSGELEEAPITATLPGEDPSLEDTSPIVQLDVSGSSSFEEEPKAPGTFPPILPYTMPVKEPDPAQEEAEPPAPDDSPFETPAASVPAESTPVEPAPQAAPPVSAVPPAPAAQPQGPPPTPESPSPYPQQAGSPLMMGYPYAQGNMQPVGMYPQMQPLVPYYQPAQQPQGPGLNIPNVPLYFSPVQPQASSPYPPEGMYPGSYGYTTLYARPSVPPGGMYYSEPPAPPQQPKPQPEPQPAPAPEPTAEAARPQPEPPQKEEPGPTPPQAAPAAPALPELSDIGQQAALFAAEVHDCSAGPQICAMIDLHQSLATAKIVSERLIEIARQESDEGIPCYCYVEFDSRYYIARYTLFGTTQFLFRSLKMIG